MAMQARDIEDLIRESFPEAKITITDLAATATTTPPRSSTPPSWGRAGGAAARRLRRPEGPDGRCAGRAARAGADDAGAVTALSAWLAAFIVALLVGRAVSILRAEAAREDGAPAGGRSGRGAYRDPE